MAICVYNRNKPMADSLMSITAQQYIMRKATEAPEDIYATIKQAEEWLKELKELARKNLDAKVPEGVLKHSFDTTENYVNLTRNRGKFKPEVVHETLTRLKIDTSNITVERPKQYSMTKGAYDLLSTYLREGILTKAQFDSFFEEGNFTVTVTPKSALAIAVNRMDNGE